MSIVVTNNDPQVTPPAEKPAESVEVVETKSEAAEEQAESADESETSEEKVESKADGDAESESEDESEEEQEPKEEVRPKKVGGAQKKINKLVSKLSDREREVEYWKEQALKSAKPQADEKVETKKSTTEGRPSSDDFETHEDYVEALADWKVEQKLSIREQTAKEDRLKTDFQRQVKAHNDRVKAFADTTPDFHDAIEEIDHIPMSITVQDIILSSDDGPALMYALAKSPEEYAKICAMPAIAAARELGKFEAKLKTTPPKKLEKKVTKAPKPVSTVRGSSGGSAKSLEDAAKAGATVYQEMRRAQMKNKSSSWG